MYPTTPRIDYQKIVEASRYYAELGYVETEVPWIIPFKAYETTAPKNERRQFATLDGYLNASGEQSFIHMLQEGVHLHKNFCITSCFRDEPVLDDIHHTYFVKLELILRDATRENLQKIIQDAKKFFDRYMETEVIQTGEDAYDIIDTTYKIEIGSYGIRKIEGFTFIYGTGLALPRFDYIINKNKK